MLMVDDKDIRIIDELIRDSRTPFLEISRKMRISEATVRKRVHDMQASGVIKRFTMDVDPSKMGFATTAVLGIDVKPENFLDVARSLAAMDEVKCLATSSGDHMIMAEIWSRNGADLSRIISDRVGRLPGVFKVCPAVILERLK